MMGKLGLLYYSKPQGITKGWFGNATIYCQLAQKVTKESALGGGETDALLAK